MGAPACTRERERAQTADRVVLKYLDRKARAPTANRRSRSGVGGARRGVREYGAVNYHNVALEEQRERTKEEQCQPQAKEEQCQTQAKKSQFSSRLMSSECTRTKRSASSPSTKRRGRKECHLVEGEKQGDQGEVDQVTRSRRTRSGGAYAVHQGPALPGHDFPSRQER